MRKQTKAIVCGAALFGVVSLAVANNTRSTEAVESEATELAVTEAEESTSAEATAMGSVANGILETAKEKGYVSDRNLDKIEKSKIIEKTFQAFLDNDYDPAAAVDKAAEVAVEQGWARSKEGAKKALRNEIEKARKNENLINKLYRALGI
ncbi:MAG: hypothetical protein MJZ32_12180 [Bacteroidaceae bacterium]|nr:hypothetical protein [Bacteroidaceae bacterium]